MITKAIYCIDKSPNFFHSVFYKLKQDYVYDAESMLAYMIKSLMQFCIV